MVTGDVGNDVLTVGCRSTLYDVKVHLARARAN
jgi:hypothetical protein